MYSYLDDFLSLVFSAYNQSYGFHLQHLQTNIQIRFQGDIPGKNQSYQRWDAALSLQPHEHTFSSTWLFTHSRITSLRFNGSLESSMMIISGFRNNSWNTIILLRLEIISNQLYITFFPQLAIFISSNSEAYYLPLFYQMIRKSDLSYTTLSLT